ncbi:hypothetical protein [Nostoc phage N1]|nr:hypothetical protein [Nostoc phage N1]
MKNPKIESNIPTVRARLHRKNIKGVSAEQIREALESNDNDVEAATHHLIENTHVDIDSGENSPESIQEEPEDFKALLKIETVSTPDETVSMVKQEATNMGLTIPVEHINSIANSVKSSRTYQSNKLQAVKAALIAYIDWQHEQSSNEATSVLQEVQQHAIAKTAEFNNQMVGELSDFFRQQENNTNQFAEELLNALQFN